MNEGKPTKAKWWNRPRPQETSARAEDTEPTPDETTGAGTPGASDAASHQAPGPTGGPGLGGDTDGDFELARPAARAADAGLSAEGDPGTDTGGGTGGDFELARPGAGGASGGEVPSGGGDFELPRPAASGGAARRDAASAEGDFELARPAAVSAAGPSAGDAGEAAGAGAGTGDDARVAAAPVEPADARPKPLHDPDPYSTPPYGEPGPWAPAPPVQHPATTPTHGTAVPSGHGTPAPPLTPAPALAAAATAPALNPAPDTSIPTPASGLPAAPAPAPGVPAPAPAPASAPGVPIQPPAPGVPAPVPAPTATPTIPTQPAPPAADTFPQAPQPPGTPTHATPTPDTPTQTAPAYADTPPPANPWQNYDPWASTPHPAAPFQQNGAAVVTEEQRRKRGRKVILVGVLLIALVSGGVGGVVGAYLERNGGVGDVELPQAQAEPTGRAPGSVAGIAARALPSVVTLHVSGSEAQGTGTGFVLDDRGHILTNNHVVEPAGKDGEISVTFHSGDTAKATVVGRDSGYDLAVVKVTGVSGLKPLPLGNSDNVQVGDPVVAIGAPYDLEGTVTAGIISAKERPITAGGEGGDGSDVSYVDALQTDAPINPGNSGGPLLDARARVVGINSAIRSADSGSDLDSGQSGSIGLGFAIPVNQAKRVAEELINTGKATHPVIGVTLDMDYSGDGARVGTKGSDGGSAVTRGGPGDKAGIKQGDIITAVDGQRVHSGEELIVKTRAHRPGDHLKLTLERGGKEITISLTLGSAGGG
ncbi:trypsin-like peptidase domain-containing protein [Streptomyces sp. NPDC059010]|uniref:S1C family serine protease n=1 Tax=Streptomyces sp. NPDC059010 TaxID=3346695 RepID=UPI0036910996